MDVRLGDIQKTALLALAMRAAEVSRPNPRIRDDAAPKILRALGVDFDDLARELGIDTSRYDPFLSHEAVVARTIMFGEALRTLIERHPQRDMRQPWLRPR